MGESLTSELRLIVESSPVTQAQECLSIFFLTENEDVQSVNNLVKYLSRHSVNVPKSLQEKADRGEVRLPAITDSSRFPVPKLIDCSIN